MCQKSRRHEISGLWLIIEEITLTLHSFNFVHGTANQRLNKTSMVFGEQMSSASIHFEKNNVRKAGKRAFCMNLLLFKKFGLQVYSFN